MSVKSANVGGIIRGPITVRQCPTPEPSSLIPTTVPATPINYQIKRAQRGFWTNWNSEKVGVFHDRGERRPPSFRDPWKFLSIVRPDQFYTSPFSFAFPHFVESIKRSTFFSALRRIINRTLSLSLSLSLFHNLRHERKKKEEKENRKPRRLKSYSNHVNYARFLSA